ncbi:MAG: FHA domain-containing protein [Planctomycetota bacterium]|jgi:pSer/pThr/pTyr-binding forkhead associated (FHA) protein
MAIFRRSDQEGAKIVVVSLAGREDLLPDFAFALDEEATLIGRHESCGIQLVDGQVSRQHVQIRFDEPTRQYFASDLKSANGTFVNGRQVMSEMRLSEGDRIEVGNSRLVFTRKRFKDHKSALQHFRRTGEHIRATMVKPPDP